MQVTQVTALPLSPRPRSAVSAFRGLPFGVLLLLTVSTCCSFFFFFFSKAWPWAPGAGFACMLREAGWKSLGFTALLQSSQVVRG